MPYLEITVHKIGRALYIYIYIYIYNIYSEYLFMEPRRR
jgi:hypothetical protein